MMQNTPFRHPQSNMRNVPQPDSSLKPPKPPERPLVPYMRFSRKMWPKVRAENPEAQLWDIGKMIGQLWRDATDTDRAIYQHEYEIEKVEYEKAIKNYQNSHAYQQYVNAKNRAKANEKTSRSRMDTGGVVIQPVDEEDSSINELSTRRLAAVRYDRNHRLISDLFSPAVVTDTRTIVAQQRMEMLKKQALSLAAHQNKLEDELQKLNDIHNEKKRTIEKNSEEFAERLKKVCEEKPTMDEGKFEETVGTWKEKLRTAYEDYKKKQDEMNAKIMAERERMMQQTPVLARLICDDDPMDGRQVDREGRDATDRDRAPPPSETPPAQAAQESPKVESNPNEAEPMEAADESGVAKEVEQAEEKEEAEKEPEKEKEKEEIAVEKAQPSTAEEAEKQEEEKPEEEQPPAEEKDDKPEEEEKKE
ncbi:hypothetical protein WR25_01862 [Diploscapter pachys]|uniref:HMG box domain-containing protein n=1 Tax=Diploscapter pachys TaxID=2018661 RepID=A0A2A2KWF0_9BILA|nr:hypothetical protein WR25_01862 [Diploscapter pachys]